MMVSSGGKPCNNCQTVLIITKWEHLLSFLTIFLVVPSNVILEKSSNFHLWQIVLALSVFIFGAYYLIGLLVPFRIKNIAKH